MTATSTNRQLQCIANRGKAAFQVGVCYEAFVGENSVCVIDEQQHQHTIPADTLSLQSVSFAWISVEQPAGDDKKSPQ